MPTHRNLLKKLDEPEIRINILKIIIALFAVIIIFRLFYLQVIKNEYYEQVAAKEHYGITELPARRGEIFIKDYASNETIRVATNVALDTLFADPTIIQNPKIVADRIAPLIFDLAIAKTADLDRMAADRKRAKTPEEYDNVKPLTDEELYKQFYDNLLLEIGRQIRPVIILSDTIAPETLKQIAALGLPGIDVTDKEVKAYPAKITDRALIAAKLAKYLDMTHTRLEEILMGKNRYVILQKKIKPEISSQIKKFINDDKSKIFYGLGLTEEYYRYYPEEDLAANVLGFVTGAGNGSYGIESTFNTQLQGKKGIFQTQRDGSVYGRQITVGDSLIQPAVDGESIVLTIDRAMQMQIEKKLEKAVIDYRADSGQVIVMDPKTGNIMALAHYPSFNPNNYGAALEKEETAFTTEEVKQLIPIESEPDTFWFYRNLASEDRFKVFREKLPDGNYVYKRYTNWIGMEALQNKVVNASYEPGSVFKGITMASALDDKDVTPNTAFNDPGVLKVDEFEIKNVSARCTGYVNMSTTLANSCNTGLAWVAKKMGRTLFYSYMKKFGFGERTDVEFDNEDPGRIAHFSQWADSELATHAFGQGFLTTPLQMVSAYSALANKGVLMQPHIVEKVIQSSGKTVTSTITPLQQVITPETSNTITAMLVNAVENGVAKNAGLPDHFIAAKTGTSQTYKYGKPVTGAGTTIATIAGFGPIEDPKFVILVKLDRPRTSEWADSTSALLFKDIAAYMFEYFGIPPDKK
jgi:stage V sporulation protein D (sporulation-specific penicillin-binding protein)